MISPHAIAGASLALALSIPAWADFAGKAVAVYVVQAEASAAKRGLWADNQPVPPWEWRSAKRQNWRRVYAATDVGPVDVFGVEFGGRRVV